jgi:large subunit ribosomal protein L19
MNQQIANLLLGKYGKKNPPQVKPGDTVRVHQRIKEGEKERIQIFEGLVIATKHGQGLDGTFTVRKMAVGGIGVERTYPLHSPNIVKVDRTKSAAVHRAKLYYMRERLGKSARFRKENHEGASWSEPAAVIEPEVVEEPVVEETPAVEEAVVQEEVAVETPVAEEAPAAEEVAVEEVAPEEEKAA